MLTNQEDPMKKRRILFWILAIVVAIALAGGSWYLARRLIPTPQVAVVKIDQELDESYTNLIGQAIEDLGADPGVRAVVLDVSCPGGGVTASESLYYGILALREKVPVFVSMGELAASGGYYISAAADQIYAKPTSLVGNIGVLSYMPDPDLVDEMLITTGPFKLTGGTATEWTRQMETLKNTFLEAVLAQRADRLTVPVETLARGEIYIGIDAKQMGLIDELGSRADAIAAAAEMAGITRYDVVDRTPESSVDDLDLLFGETGAEPAEAKAGTAPSPAERLAPGIFYLYLQPGQ
jgi:protease IV